MSDDPIEVRADDLAAREHAAGGPDALVARLIRGQRRQWRFSIITAVSVAFDVMLSIVLAVVVIDAVNTANHSDQNTTAITQLVHQQAVDNWNQCMRSNVNTTKINSTNRAFVTFLNSLPVGLTPEDRANFAAFVQIYNNALLDVPVCGPQPPN